MGKSEFVFDVEEGEFHQKVIERSRDVPVLVDFWAPWCGPCRMLSPILETVIAERNGEVLLAKVNVDEAQELAGRYGIMSIPALIGFRDGQPVIDFVGLLPEPQLRELIDRLLPSQADRLARQARDLETTQPAEAERLFRQALALERGHEGAEVGLARLLMAQGKLEEATELLDNVVPGSVQGEEAERLKPLIFLRQQAQPFGSEADARRRLQAAPTNAERLFELGSVLAAAGKYEEALQSLLAAAERDSHLASNKVRESMVKIFQVIGVRNPLADEYREKLTQLLY